MNVEENNGVRLFGFKINNTVAVVLFFLSFTMMIGMIPYVYYLVWSLLNMLISSSISELLTVSFDFILFLGMLFIQWLTVIIFFYIIIVCFSKRKFLGRNEDIEVKWFGFRLNKTSLTALFLLSLVLMMTELFSLINSTGLLMNYLRYSYIPRFIIIQSILVLIVSSILVIVFIYTLVVCGKGNKKLLKFSR
jgi:hypothetical protein